MSKALEALLDYRQLDAAGVVVEASRQAIHEVAAEIERLEAESKALLARANLFEELHTNLTMTNERLEARNARLLAALKEGHDCLLDVGSGGGGWAWEEVAAAMHEAITTEEKEQSK